LNFYLEATELIFLSIFSLFDFFPLQSEGTGGGYRTSTTMPRAMHVHLLDFNEHVHSEDSMPRGTHIHFQKARMMIKERNHFKAMAKTKSNEDIFQNKVAEHAVEDVAMMPVCTFQYF